MMRYQVLFYKQLLNKIQVALFLVSQITAINVFHLFFLCSGDRAIGNIMQPNITFALRLPEQPSFFDIIITEIAKRIYQLCRHEMLSEHKIQQQKNQTFNPPMNKNNLLKPNRKFVNYNSKSPAVESSKSNSKNDLSNIRNWKDSQHRLPKKMESKKIPVTKTLQDEKNHYKYKGERKDLDHRSTLPELSNFILNLINKSEDQELSNTDKYMLSGYINIYIKQKYVMSDIKDNTTLTLEKLKTQWSKVCDAWELYKIKLLKCRIGQNWHQKQEQISKRFQIICHEISNVHKKNQKLQPIKKLMKKFYTELVN